MLRKMILHYTSSFSGLSREVWWLALITLINRAGAMVIPFLSLYLKDSLGFEVSQVGWIMTSFGLGSFFGSWIGGKLSDLIGYYKVILGSLILSGISFICIQYIHSFWGICIAFFILISIADAARPAFFVALSAYSKPENKTRSLTFIRLAINLGFTAGPALGGLIIAIVGYNGLFWVDGVTCVLAGLVMIKTLNPKKARISDQEKVIANPLPAHKDGLYVIFLLSLAIFGFIFVQYFSTIPLYYKEVHKLSEKSIGLLLAMNGFIIFIFEMPLIAYLEKTSISKLGNVIVGFVLTGLSFLLLLITPWSGILIIGMILATLGEMVAFPFGNSFALERSKRGRQGAYMGLYSMAFSLAHIFGHNSGMQFIATYGYDKNWLFMALMAVIGMGLLYYVKWKAVRLDTRML
ncbi:MFS transporter [Aquimarina brevivitae]|uniref:Putative MFS family arabinose efflux permease n=1 Tax=Aquimarina brevivitae TaxID=323412 RepID=A0A4V2F7L2_9FLAO|nr:MFS transporter [Aquimarina brevivitae]RZT00210.1 putative MFS family arabinose efflux permease [Aquimarina brevivitae]